MGFRAGDANLYRFVGNDPTNLIDPSGLQPPGRLQLELDELQKKIRVPSSQFQDTMIGGAYAATIHFQRPALSRHMTGKGAFRRYQLRTAAYDAGKAIEKARIILEDYWPEAQAFHQGRVRKGDFDFYKLYFPQLNRLIADRI
jgi:hypothetical protein